jgi:hypothetical protein
MEGGSMDERNTTTLTDEEIAGDAIRAETTEEDDADMDDSDATDADSDDTDADADDTDA